MKVSYNWLKDYLDLSNVSHDELFKEISFHINEIETYKKMINATNLMIGEVLECVDHPDSDHLHVCQVKLKDGISQIVCGAPNVGIGQKVIVALPGAELPGDFKIKAAKVRGVESNGMICSLQELGFEEKYVPEQFKDGIYILDNDAIIGNDPLEYLSLDDYIIDLELTSNRSDLLSVEGVAYDIGAVLNQQISPVLPIVKEDTEANPVSVEIKTPYCHKYYARYVKNVVIKDSPWWLKARLIASGIRPINNVVDVTNYVMLELGQPLHAFDADKLGNKIVVRNALENETIVTLDNIERKLSTEDVVITNGKDALCVAGVMGGASTEVTSTTKNIVLESAYFDPRSVRKTSSKLGLKSESSTRFERKVDINRIEVALDRAAQLLQGLADATILKGVNGIQTVKYEPQYVNITTTKINNVLGTNLSDEQISDIFTRLQYSYEVKNNEYIITIPSRRMDLEASYQDIIEDVVRIYGYNSVPTVIAPTSDRGRLTDKQKNIRNIRVMLANMGLNESVTYSLINKNNLNDFTLGSDPEVALLMPMSEDKAVMRQSLLNGVIEAVAYNKARRIDDVAIFEIGKKYSVGKETLLLSGALTGLFTKSLWQGQKQKVDFYVVKGILEKLFNHLNVNVEFVSTSEANKNFHPGRTALIKLNDKVVGVLANLHPKYAKENSLGDTYVFELDLDAILDSKVNTFKYEPICKYPSVTRDLAIVVKKEVEAGEIIKVIKQTARKYLIDLEVFDLYVGENVNADEKSLAIKLTFQDSTKTLETADVDKVISSILNRLDFNLKARLR